MTMHVGTRPPTVLLMESINTGGASGAWRLIDVMASGHDNAHDMVVVQEHGMDDRERGVWANAWRPLGYYMFFVAAKKGRRQIGGVTVAARSDLAMRPDADDAGGDGQFCAVDIGGIAVMAISRGNAEDHMQFDGRLLEWRHGFSEAWRRARFVAWATPRRVDAIGVDPTLYDEVRFRRVPTTGDTEHGTRSGSHRWSHQLGALRRHECEALAC